MLYVLITITALVVGLSVGVIVGLVLEWIASLGVMEEGTYLCCLSVALVLAVSGLLAIGTVVP